MLPSWLMMPLCDGHSLKSCVVLKKELAVGGSSVFFCPVSRSKSQNWPASRPNCKIRPKWPRKTANAQLYWKAWKLIDVLFVFYSRGDLDMEAMPNWAKKIILSPCQNLLIKKDINEPIDIYELNYSYTNRLPSNG